MGKSNTGRWAEKQTRTPLPDFAQTSIVIASHARVLRWCAEYAKGRCRNCLSLRDIPDDVFASLGSSQGTKIEALGVLYLHTAPNGRAYVEDLDAVLPTALVALDLEGLRRAGELDLRDEDPPFSARGEVWIKPVPGSDLERLTGSAAAAGDSGA